MGGLIGRYKEHRDQSMKKASAENPQNSPLKPKKRENRKSQSPKPTGEADVKKTEWTNVELSVPDPLADLKSQIIDEPPVPPPRKKSQKTLERQRVVVNLEKRADDYKDMKPVEEPVIVPKKEPVHICDGHHHHVCNFHNGRVVQDSHVEHSHHLQNHKQIEPKKQTAQMQSVHQMKQKNHSTVSLPDYAELNKSDVVKKSQEEQPRPPKRNISVISLPTESKVTLSDATATRLENYMARCKSFNGLPPKQLLDRLQDEHHSDSEDSWDDGIVEMTKGSEPLQSPVQPKCRLDFPSPTRNQNTANQVEKPAVAVLKLPHTSLIKETIAERRESIDDFFDAKASLPGAVEEQSRLEQYSAERRDSDAFFDLEPVALDKNSLKSSIYYTNALIQSESRNFQPPKTAQQPPEPTKVDETNVANGTAAGDGGLLESIMEFYDTHENLSANSPPSPQKSEKNTTEKEEDTVVEHSNLLKIIQENASAKANNDDVDSDMKFYIPEPLRTALVELDQKINKIDAERQAATS